MYLRYFGLEEPPFRITPDTKYLFMTKQYESALDAIQYGIDQRMGFLVLTGEVGTGKTTLTRKVLADLRGDVETALLINPLLSVSELLQAINRDFGVHVTTDATQLHIEALNQYLLGLQAEGKTALVVIDEAQNLSVEALEMIRLLSNLETDKAKLLQILLVGQPELEKKIKSFGLRQLRQRIAVHVSLRPLALLEVVRYIAHRLTTAGGGSKIYIESGAYRLIYRLTKGTPRLINLLCDRALIGAYAADTPMVGCALVRRAHRDLGTTIDEPPVWQFWRRLGMHFG